MPRAATPAETARPVVPASPAIAAAARAFIAARDLASGLEGEGDWSNFQQADKARGWLWLVLESLVLRDPQKWHVVGDLEWTGRKISKCGLEVISRPHR